MIFLVFYPLLRADIHKVKTRVLPVAFRHKLVESLRVAHNAVVLNAADKTRREFLAAIRL